MTPFDLVKQRMQLGYYQSVSHCVRSVYKMEGFSAFYRSFPVTLGMNIPYGCVMVAANEGCKKVINPSGQYSFSSIVISGCTAGGIAGLVTTPLDVIKTRLQTQELEPFQKAGTGPGTAAAVSHSACPSMIAVSRVTAGGSSPPAAASLYTSTAAASAVPLCESDPFPKLVTHSAPRYSGVLHTARTIFVEEGLKGFLRGAGARMLVHAPSVAISWTTYETLKHLIGGGGGATPGSG
jgi:solute carrier family 25 iron transporter 28/37